MKALDFFCGAGGLTRGLLDAGIDVVGGVDIDERLRATYEANNAPSRFLRSDIADIDIHRVREELGVRDTDLVIYAACTPCQPFSTLNRSKGKDDRKNLLLSFAELVRQAPPDFILVENVPGLNTAYGREVYEGFAATLEQSGFDNVYAEFLDAKNFGVPQVRKRFILLASRRGEIIPPAPLMEDVSLRRWIGHYPPIADGEACHTVPNHESRRMMPHHRKIVEAVPVDGGNRRDVTDTSILLKCHQRSPNAHKDVFGRMAWGEPAPTMTGRCTDVYCGRFTHPEQHRGVSLREAAAIQSFRDDYVFHGTFFHIAHQIGNAVPVRFAEQLGRAIVASLA